MIGIVCCLNVNYAILRSARNALAVTDLGGGAQSIPWFELCGTMPGAVLMTMGLAWLLNRMPIHKVFFVSLALFVSFFILFSFVIYPALPQMVAFLGTGWMAAMLPKLASLLFFVMAELWKIALLTILFWGFVNQSISMENAKKYYAPLMLGGSVGTVLASPIISLCTSDALSGKSWGYSLVLMTGVLVILSAVAALCFFLLSRSLKPVSEVEEEEKENLSVLESIKICFRSSHLFLLAWLTIADYVAYAIGEVVFFDVLKTHYPDPRDYCDFMGKLSLWSGILTAFSALVITPYLLRRCRWVVASLVTPICLLVTLTAFFLFVWHPALAERSGLVILSGSLFFCLVRAAKFTLFDTSKEISFLLLPGVEKMQGKLVIDGMCARLGRGGASFLSLSLIQACGGVLAMVPIAGALAIGISASCVFATSRLGVLVDKASKKTLTS